MGALILILPTLAFDIWLGATIGKQQIRRWMQSRAWSHFIGVCAAGLALAICGVFIVRYNWDAKTRVTGFPIPLVFLNLEDKTRSLPPAPWFYLGAITNFLTGFALPLVPYKAAEFIRTVKREINS